MDIKSKEVIGHIGKKKYCKTIVGYNPVFHTEQVRTAMNHIKQDVIKEGLDPNNVTFEII